ncbi:MAG TPA: hypothetical protein VGD65_21760 [Chryseosolibacter sp.]
MNAPFFEETQRLRDNPWVLVLIFAVALGPMIPLLYGLYWQIGHGVPWGNEPMEDAELIMLTVFILLTTCTVGFVMASLRLETRIDEAGIHYRMFPVKSKWRVVNPDELEEYSFATRYKPFESGGIGHHRNVLKNMRSFRISGGKHIILKYKNGHRLLLGTQDPGGMEWAIRRLMNKTRV